MAATFVMTSLSAAAIALSAPAPAYPTLPEPLHPAFEFAAADCNAAASRVVSQTDGQLLSVSASQQGGKTVCKITVLVPGSGDKRPRKVTKTVSQ